MTDAVVDLDVADPPPAPPAEPVAVVDPPVPVADPPAEPAPTPEPPSRQNDPLIATITGLRAQKREADQRAERAEREAQEAKAMLERSMRGQNPDASPAPTPPAAPLPDAEIDRRADYKLFVRDVQSMQQKGIAEFGPAFNASVQVLEAVGANDDAFVAQVLAVAPDSAHRLLKEIANDTQRAVMLVGMDPVRRIAELTRMAMANNPTGAPDASAAPGARPPAPKSVSRAPAPPPPVDPSASKVVDWRTDEASEEEFDRGFQEMMQKRSGRR